MLGETLGPYRLIAELGSGGMGTVYLAEVVEPVGGLDPGYRVAVKVVHPRLVENREVLQRFLREASAGRVVDHPNIVRTLDAGSAETGGTAIHYLVMEFVQGQTLRALLREEGALSEELCRHLGRELARGLAAVHGAGIIHRDVKPENVLITLDQEVRLMDLGVARLRDEATRLTRTGVFVGSLNYASPEQLREGSSTVDARTDLYSLGVLLYEAAAGKHPCGGGGVGAVLRQVLLEEPLRLGQAGPGTTPFLEAVVQRLLAKEREDRFASAEDLLDVLEEGETGTWWRCRAPLAPGERGSVSQRRRPLRETSLVGRDGEMTRLKEAWGRALEGRGQVVLLEGEAGIGKSRLADEFVSALAEEAGERHFLFGSYPPMGVAAASGALSAAFREYLGAEGLEAALRARLGGSAGTVSGLAAVLRGEVPPSGGEPLTREAMAGALVRLTRSLARERPVILLVDDLHFAPEQGRALFGALAVNLAAERVLLLGTARPGLPLPWLSALEGMDHVQRVALPRLAAGDLARILHEAVGGELAVELGPRILAKSDGNPFFAIEILRGLREGRFLARDTEGGWVKTRSLGKLDVPSSVTDLIQARIAELDEEDRNLLEVAACCGFTFDPLLVGDVLGMAPIPLLKRLARLERVHRLVRVVGLRYEFDHHQVQEALQEGLAELLRREYHAALAEALERRSRGADRDPEDLDGSVAHSLADHFLRGGRADRSLRYIDRALDFLERSHLHDDAVELASRVAEVPGLLSREQRLLVLMRKAERLELLGRWEEERRTLDDALRQADGTGDAAARARVRRRFGSYLSRHSRHDEALVALMEARALAREAGDIGEEAAILGQLGVACWHLGRYHEARGWHDRREALGQPPPEPHSTGDLGETFLSLGLPLEARDHLLRQVALAREMGDRRSEALATGNLGGVHYDQGEYGKARACFDSAVVLAREVGDRRAEARAGGNLGRVLRDLGEPAEARVQTERSLSLCREIGYLRGEARALGHLSRLALDAGQFDEAVLRARRYLRISGEIGARSEEAHAMRALGDALAAGGQPAEAARMLAASLTLAEGLAHLRGRVAAHIGLARLHLAAGRRPAGLRHLQEARSLAAEGPCADERVLAEALLAETGEGDRQEAREVLLRHAPRMRVPERMAAEAMLNPAREERA